MKHIELSRLFAFAEGAAELRGTEQGHIATCVDCQQVLEVYKTYLSDSGEREKVTNNIAAEHRFGMTAIIR